MVTTPDGMPVAMVHSQQLYLRSERMGETVPGESGKFRRESRY